MHNQQQSISDLLSSSQEAALKSISIGFFANNSDDLDVRTTNCLIYAEKNNKLEHLFGNLYDLYVAPSRKRNLLLNIPNFGKNSLIILNKALSNLVEDDSLLQIYEDLCNQTPESLSDYESIDQLLKKEISCLADRRLSEIIKLRFLDKKKQTLEEIGAKFDVTRERIRQLEITAKSKLTSSLQMRFTKEEIFECSRDWFESFFFKNNSFVSLKMAKKILNDEDEPTYRNLFIRINSNNLESFLNRYFLFDKNFKGWFNSISGNHEYTEAGQGLSFNEALNQAKWPIKLNSIALKMNLPEVVALDFVLLSKNLEAFTIDNQIYIKYIKLRKSVAVRLALSRFENGANFIEIQEFIRDAFDIEISIRAVSANLDYLQEAVLIERGRYSKYMLFEYLNLDQNQIDNIKEFAIEYLMDMQEYVSASIIYNQLLRRNNSTKFGFVKSSYVLYEICKTDKRFISGRGAMLGLKSDKFQGVFTPLMKEYINLMKKYNHPLTARKIVKELSSTRSLLEAAVFNQLDNDAHGIFVRIGNGFYLAQDLAQTNKDEFWEVDFEDT